MKTVLITGANRGLGLEFTRQLSEQNYRVIATCRDPLKASFLQQLEKANEQLSIHQLDVCDDQSIANLSATLGDTPIDWLLCNAGTLGEPSVTIGNLKRDNYLHVINVNCLGALKVCEAFLPNLEKSEDRLIISISSVLGNVSADRLGGAYAYRCSKAALNCGMRALAIDVASINVKVMLIHPGWVRTDLGGPNGEIDVEFSVTNMLRVIERNKGNCHAELMYSYNGDVIAW